MARKIGIGNQDFGMIQRENCFYVDKIKFFVFCEKKVPIGNNAYIEKSKATVAYEFIQ